MEDLLSQIHSSDFLCTYSASICNTSDIINFIHTICIPISQEELTEVISVKSQKSVKPHSHHKGFPYG